MFKKNILNLFLFITFIILATVIYLSEEKSSMLETLTKINLSEITSINIRHNKNNTSLSKQPDDQWNITQPLTMPANNFRINSILKLANAPVHNQYHLDEIDLQTTGLAPAETSIQFNNLTISFGITNPVTNLRYIKLDDLVYTIEDVYSPLISSHFSTLVSLHLLAGNKNLPGRTIEKLVLINQTIAKNDKGLWQSNINMSTDSVVKTIQQWQQQQAFAVHEYIKRDALGEVFIYFENQPQPLTYVITDTDPWLIIARPEIGLEYHLELDAYDLLISPVDNKNKESLPIE